MTDFEKSVSKVIDNLSVKYDFFYIVKNNKLATSILMILYILFVIFIIDRIYEKNSFQGIIENILPFFVDVAIVFFVTIFILSLRTIYNDESGRIIETRENIIINHTKNLNISLQNINIDFNKHKYYSQPEIIKNLLKWVNFNKDDYFRTHYGSLDISKIAINEITIENNSLNLICSQTSFYDISFTHYFPDYILSSSKSKDIDKQNISLRALLKNNIDDYYQKRFHTNNIKLFDLLPNPLGLTGIIKFNFSDTSFYLVQVRHKSEAAAKDKIQWSFAGTIDVIPNLYKDTILFKEFIDDELYDEILDKEENFKILKNHDILRHETLIGFVVNPLYLYQPEFFVVVEYNLNNNFNALKQKLYENEKRFIKYGISKQQNIIALSSLENIEKYIINEQNINTRNLFKPGFEFILEFNKTGVENR